MANGVDKAIAERDALKSLLGPSNMDGSSPAPMSMSPPEVPAPPLDISTTDIGGGMGNHLPDPTPVDNTAALLDQRSAQADAHMKSQGFDGYTPDISDAQQWDPDQQNMMVKAVGDMAAGFNISLARVISAPREIVDRAMGLLGLDYMQHGGPQQMTIDAINRMGVPAYEVENLANKIGRGALPAMATWAAMSLGAPSLAASQGTGATGYLMREVGEWTMKHPVVGLWLGQASQAGGKVATDLTGSDNPLVEFGGELAGGLAPGVAKFAAQKVPGVRFLTKTAGDLAGAAGESLANALPTDMGNAVRKYNPFYQQPSATAPGEPLINKNFDANRLQTFSKDQITGAQLYQDKAIENAISSIPTSGTPGQIQSRTHGLLEDAEKISKRIVSGFWERVPLRTRIGVNDLRRDVQSIRTELADLDNQRPDGVIDNILSATAPVRQANGQFRAAQPTVAKLRDIQSQIGTAITEERARDAPREGMVRNMARISEAIDDNIAGQLPNDTSIEQARQMSRRHNDLFSRGPINDILAKRRTGDFRVSPNESIDTLMEKTDGLAALKAVQEGVSTYPRIPTTQFRPRAYYASPNAVTPAEKAQLDQLVSSAEDSIRGSFRAAAEQGPDKAVKYVQSNEDAIKVLSKVSGELGFAAQKVSAALGEKKYVNASALARFSQTSPEKAVANIFAQKDPADTARQLMISFRGDPDALDGLRNQVLDHFFYTVGKTNPNTLQKMVQEPRYQNMLEAVLAPDQYARLTRLVNTAVRIGAEDETSLTQAFKYPARTAGRIIGAAVGRKLGTGTIQTPGIISKAAGEFVEKQFGTTNPQDLLSMAVLDPAWEKMLYSRNPTNAKEMKQMAVHFRRMFAGINSGFQGTLNKLSKDDNDEQ